MVNAAATDGVVAIIQTVWMWSTAAAFALFLVASFILWGFRGRMPTRHALLWAVLIVVLPVVGPILWFTLGRRRYPAKVEESFTVPSSTRRLG